MTGQAADGDRARFWSGRGRLCRRTIALRLELFQRQFELRDLAAELLGRGTELHPSQPGNLPAQGVDKQIAGGERGVRTDERGFQPGDPRGGIV